MAGIYLPERIRCNEFVYLVSPSEYPQHISRNFRVSVSKMLQELHPGIACGQIFHTPLVIELDLGHFFSSLSGTFRKTRLKISCARSTDSSMA